MKNGEIIKELLIRAAESQNLQMREVLVMFSNDLSNGDYSSNIALVAAKEIKTSPKALADKLVAALYKNGLPKEVKKVEVAGIGFINFYLSSRYMDEQIKGIVDLPEKYGASLINAGKKILVEHSSPNLFKPFHIGHLMNNTIGESIARLAQFSGAEVTKISYPSDISLGIGKAIWALNQEDAIRLDSFDSLEEKVAFLGECYVRGTNAFIDNVNVQQQVRDITKKLYDKVPGAEFDMFEKCKELNLSYFKSIIEKLGSSFDSFIFESEAGVEGEKIVSENIGKVFENSNGAIIYRGEDEGLHTRVFVNREGYPTYESKDIGLLSLKFKRYNPDISIFVTDNEQRAYFEVVSSAASKIDKDWSDKTIHLTHGRMTFKGKKMSSRLGGVPLATTIIDAVSEEVKSRKEDLDNSSAEAISIGAVKFTVLRVMAGKDINFDPDTSLSFEGDSGPYLQYTAVRAASILKRAKEGNMVSETVNFTEDRDISKVERIVVRFPEVVDLAIKEWSPHHLVTYLLELAQAFNGWYVNTKVLDSSNPSMQNNIMLTSAVYTVIKNGLRLLGIQVPASM